MSQKLYVFVKPTNLHVHLLHYSFKFRFQLLLLFAKKNVYASV